MTPVELLLSKLPDAKRNGKGWQARCPAHDDRRPSLSVAEGDDGRALVNCHAGCTTEAVASAVGLKMTDLMARTDGHKARPARKASSSKRDEVFASSAEAVEALERRHGRRSADWTYHDAEGEPVGLVVRWDGADGKDVRPVSRNGQGWIIGGMPEPRPLYGLSELLELPEGARVYVCEGEKAADAARAVGLNATTSPHGSKSASKADWSVLRCCEVVIVPDADDAGEAYAEVVMGMLAKLTPAPVVKIVRLPDLPFGEGGDMADFVALRGGDAEAVKAEVEALANNAEAVDLSPDEPTQPPIGRFQPFPVEALPEPVSSFVNDSAEAVGCDPSFVALPLLVGFASAIGNTRRIQLKQAWTEPAIVWAALIGESGSTKSPALELALRAVRHRQDRAMRDYREVFDQWQRDNEVFEAKKAAWKREATNRSTAATAGDPPEAPEPPTCDRCWTDDITIEALAKLLQDNPRGLLVIRDELAGWLHFDRYSANGRGGEAAKWLEMHGGRPLVVDRKTSGTIYVPEAAASIIGGIQPGILARYVGQEQRDSGLLARLLLTMPPRRPKRWTEADIDPRAEDAIANIFEDLYRLTPASNADGEPRPLILKMTPEGKRAWIAFYDEHNEQQAELTGDLAAAWSKLEGYAARLALVHHLVRQAAGEQVGEGIEAVSIAAGVKLSRWFAHEARRVYAMLAEDEDTRQSRRLVELIERKGGEVSVRTWQRARSHRTAEDAEAELEGLVEANFGRWETPASGPRGGRPSKRFVLIGGDAAE